MCACKREHSKDGFAKAEVRTTVNWSTVFCKYLIVLAEPFSAAEFSFSFLKANTETS